MNSESAPPHSRPTRAELAHFYPSRLTWEHLKTIIAHDKLRLLQRNKALQARYQLWSERVTNEYGTMANYVLKRRLQWGRPDSLAVISSVLDDHSLESKADFRTGINGSLPTVPSGSPPHFTAEAPPSLVSIIQNDWPYSTPSDVESSIIWTVLPIFHPSVHPPELLDRLRDFGFFGFTGLTAPLPPAADLLTCLPALSEWAFSEADLILDSELENHLLSEELQKKLEQVREEVSAFVEKRWNQDQWETAWWVNPLKCQSIPELTHIHVLAKPKQSRVY